MRVMNQPQINYRSTYSPNFKANANRGSFGFNTTYFFRDGIIWDKFGDFLINKYKNADNVHIYNYACSEGAEPFSLAMLLIKKLGKEKAQKFFPIIASDIDDGILKNPALGIIKPSGGDLLKINMTLEKDYSDFYELNEGFQVNKELRDRVYTGKVKPILRDAVVFTQRNILNDTHNIQRDNSVVLCRNFWPYLSSDEEREKLAIGLAERLGDNSMCVIGDFDKKCGIGKFFLDRQFINPLDTFDASTPFAANELCFVKTSPKERVFLVIRNI